MSENPTVADGWEDLSPDQRAGMTEDYWNSLPEANRQAFLDTTCSEPGCTKPRAYGSPWCEEHIEAHQP
jgi:hypothetical protein